MPIRLAPDAAGRTAALSGGHPAATAKHPIVRLFILIIAPLLHISVHVAQTPRVQPIFRITSHFCGPVLVVTFFVCTVR
jgi:hypothetical protein